MAIVDLTLAPYGKKADGEACLANPTQEKVLAWVDRIRALPEDARDHIHVLYLQGGVGSGKTRAIMAPVTEMLLEIPGLFVFWGRQDFVDLKLSAMDKFMNEVMPREMFGRKNEQYHWYEIKQDAAPDNPSKVFFGGLKDLSGLGSQEFGVIVVTEVHEISELAYRTLKRRCRQRGVPNMILLEGEPPNEGHWLTRLTDPKDPDYDRDIEVWELSTYENWDNLPVAYRGSLESMPEAWKRKYLFGKPGFIPKGKPFYQGFKEQWHTGWFDWNPELPLIVSWDFGYHHPAVSFHQFSNRWYVLRELMGSRVTIDKFCDEVKGFINTHFPNAKTLHYGDPAGLQVNDKSERSSVAICRDKGFDIKCRPNGPQTGYRARKEIIDRKMSTIEHGKPLLQVDSRCKIIIEGFLGGYHYAEENAEKAINTKYEEPFHDDFYSHLMNTVEYFAVNTLRPVERHELGKSRRRTYSRAPVMNAGFGYSKG